MADTREVPREPTIDMAQTALDASRQHGPIEDGVSNALPVGYELYAARLVWRAMYDASPAAVPAKRYSPKMGRDCDGRYVEMVPDPRGEWVRYPAPAAEPMPEKRGDYWLTPEGRKELRETFDDPNDGNAVRPLLDALERTEKLSADRAEPVAQQPEAPHEQHHLSTSDAITQHAPTPEAPTLADDDLLAALAKWSKHYWARAEEYKAAAPIREPARDLASALDAAAARIEADAREIARWREGYDAGLDAELAASRQREQELRERVAAWKAKWPNADVIPITEITDCLARPE